jgi:predicted AlkP superfamily phosphohydrolase/phosphomutase
MPTKILTILLDAADKDLLRAWAAAGHLPTIRQLETSALRGTVENPFALYVGAVWPSFFTGVSPARHGRYSYTQLVPGTYRTRAVLRADVNAPTFWTTLSRAGRRVAIIDVPKAPAGDTVEGIQVVDWGLHETELDGGLWTTPRSLARTLLDRYGPDPVGCCDLIGGRPEEYADLTGRLLRRVAVKSRMIRDVVREGEWDLVVAGFADTHCAGHQLWRLHAEAAGGNGGDALREVYAAADRALGEILDDVDGDTTVIVLASHGIGPFRGGNKILDDVLRAIDAGADGPPGVERRALARAQILWKRLVPTAVKRALITVRQRTWHRLQGALLQREYARRRYFAVPNNDAYGAIRLNVAGREPHGLVRAEEREAVEAELARELRALVDLDTGGPAVSRVVRAIDHYPGAADLPDLFVEWIGQAPIVRVRTGRGRVVEGYYPDYRTGDHRPDGGFWIRGPGVEAGEVGERVSIMDFAPTIGHLLGVPLPGVDGRPIEAAVAGAAALTESARPRSSRRG